MTLALALLLSAVPAVDEKQAPEADRPWEIYAGALGGLRVDTRGGGGVGFIGVNRRFWIFRPEIALGLGAYAQPADMLTTIRIGTRIELPLSGSIRPYAWVAFAHNHESSFVHVRMDFFGHLFGLSHEGVGHRSGLDLGLGVSWDTPLWHTRLGARLSFAQFFGDNLPPRYLDLSLTVGWTI
jgi:hypothetical protein